MKLYNPVWIVLGGVWLAHATGILSTTAGILVGVDQSVNAAIDMKKWFPQVKAYVHEHHRTAGGVLLAPKPANIKTDRNWSANRQINTRSYRLGNGGGSVSEKVLPGIERE
jgi:hypothetical protein